MRKKRGTMGIVNAVTGKSPSPEEEQALRSRAVEIFQNPYASPEQTEWAINVYPEGFSLAFDRLKPAASRAVSNGSGQGGFLEQL